MQHYPSRFWCSDVMAEHPSFATLAGKTTLPARPLRAKAAFLPRTSQWHN